MIKSPLRYPGGKSRAIVQISDLVPEFKEFREPFVGPFGQNDPGKFFPNHIGAAVG